MRSRIKIAGAMVAIFAFSLFAGADSAGRGAIGVSG
jgi:hypothetical protein